jgi:hypothetical protein
VQASNPIQFTDATGRFRYGGLKGGNLTLRVTHQEYLSKELPNVNPDTARSSRGLVIPLETGGEIVGKVLDSAGKPRANVPVYLIGSDSASNQTARTDGSGQFTFRGVAAGAYTVKAFQLGVPGKSATEEAEKTVKVASAGREAVVLTLEVAGKREKAAPAAPAAKP